MPTQKNYKAIVTIPAWAEKLMHVGDGEPDELISAAQAYAYAPLIRRATRLRANALIRPRIELVNKKSGQPVPWPFAVKPKSLIWANEVALDLTGAAYNEKLTGARSGKVKDLKWINPTTMTVQYSDENYTFSQGGKNKWSLDSMVYMREFSLSDDVGPGDGPAKNAMTNAGLMRYMSRFASAFFQRGAMPVTIVSVENLTDEDEAKRYERRLKSMMSGIKRAWNMFVSNRNVETKVLTQPLKDMVFPDLYDQALSEVSLAFEIPEAMLTSANNRSVTEEHRLSFWQDTVQPRGEWMAEQFNEQVFDSMGLVMAFLFDELDVFQADEATRSASVQHLTTAIKTDPKAALFSMDILGYDMSQDQKDKYAADFLTVAETPPTEPAAAPVTEPVQTDAVMSSDRGRWQERALSRWKTKSLKQFAKTGTAACTFDSADIAQDVRWGITEGLENCKTEHDVQAEFGRYKSADGDDELKALIAAVRVEAEAIGKAQMR